MSERKDIFKGYRIREDGTVTSRFGRTLKPQPGNTGYLRVELAGKKYLLHRLLATAFIPNPDAKPQVNHKDGNKTNNSSVFPALRAEVGDFWADD